jgi:hypothetical protein
VERRLREKEQGLENESNKIKRRKRQRPKSSFCTKLGTTFTELFNISVSSITSRQSGGGAGISLSSFFANRGFWTLVLSEKETKKNNKKIYIPFSV